jgi:hypothetical protein
MSEQQILEKLTIVVEKLVKLETLVERMQVERGDKRTTKRIKAKPDPLTSEEIEMHQKAFSLLYDEWLDGRETLVQSQLEAKDVEELRRFADSNNLNVTSKMSRDRVLQLIGARFREKRQLHRGPALRSDARAS